MAMLTADTAPFTGERLAMLRLEFARNSFLHVQDVLRFLDQKAFYVLSAVGVLTTALGIYSSIMFGFVARETWQGPAGVALGGAALLYLLVAFSVIVRASSVFRPRRGAPDQVIEGAGLFFLPTAPPAIRDDLEGYGGRIAAMEGVDILADYAAASAALSAIYREKERRVTNAIAGFRFLAVLWISVIVMLSAAAML